MPCCQSNRSARKLFGPAHYWLMIRAHSRPLSTSNMPAGNNTEAIYSKPFHTPADKMPVVLELHTKLEKLIWVQMIYMRFSSY